MKIFGLQFGKKAPPAPDMPSGKSSTEEILASFSSPATPVGDTPRVGGARFLSESAGVYDPPALTARAVSVIVSRALQASFEGRTSLMRTRLAAGNPSYTPRQLFQSIYEGLLIQGNVLLYREGRHIHFGTVGLSLSDGRWGFSKFDPRRGAFGERGNVAFDSSVLLRWDMQQGATTLGASPAEMAEPAAQAYDRAVEMLCSYAERGVKIGGIIRQADEYGQPEEVAKYLRAVKKQLREPGTSHIVTLLKGFEAVPFPGNAPALRESIEEAVTAVARIYGVPVAFLGISQKGVRQPPAEMNAHLVLDAVVPLLQTVADGLSHLLEGQVDIDTRNLQSPTFEQRVQTAKSLSQSGLMTINELRDILGAPPLPDGDRLPEAAGAPERGGVEQEDPERVKRNTAEES